MMMINNIIFMINVIFICKTRSQCHIEGNVFYDVSQQPAAGFHTTLVLRLLHECINKIHKPC